jgi:hypothetical protein
VRWLTPLLCFCSITVPREPAPAPAEGEAPAARDASGPALFSDNEYTGRCLVHLDAFCWVQRDSYLPQVRCCLGVQLCVLGVLLCGEVRNASGCCGTVIYSASQLPPILTVVEEGTYSITVVMCSLLFPHLPFFHRVTKA